MQSWCVTYVIEPPVPLAPGGGERNAPPGANLRIEGEALVGLTHTIDCEDGEPRDAVVSASMAKLSWFFAALRYLQLKKFNYWGNAVRLVPPESGLRFFGRGSGTTGTRPVSLPLGVKSENASTRLADWLLMASDAQESTSESTALRHYAVILEEIESSKPGRFADYECIKAMRDFVSHARIENKKTISKLERCAPNLPKDGTDYQFQPASPLHRGIVAEWRSKARELVDGELAALLGLVGPKSYSER